MVLDPVTMAALVYSGQKIGSAVAGWIVPNKSPWQRYQEKVEWIAKSEAPGAMSNEEIRGIVSTAPTIGADLSTMNSAQDSTSAQRTSLKDNRALVEGVSDQVHSMNSELRILDAKKRLSSTISTLQNVSKQNELKANWKKGLMGVAAEQSIDDWEEQGSKTSAWGGIIGGGLAGLAVGGSALLSKEAATGIPAAEAPAFGSGVAPVAHSVAHDLSGYTNLMDLLQKKRLLGDMAGRSYSAMYSSELSNLMMP